MASWWPVERGMTVSLIQYLTATGVRGVAAIRDGAAAVELPGVASTLAFAHRALREGVTLIELVDAHASGVRVDLTTVRLLVPIDHDDPSHLLLSGTGLTHLGSAEGRDKMHRTQADVGQRSDSMKMFIMGVEGGKPAAGQRGVQPEWFFKGNGSCLVEPGAPLLSPDFAQDAGEEPEIAGVYLVADDGRPVRLGFALANEFSDHVTERGNYLWLAHSKLRPAALGPELLLGELPPQVLGISRILRDGRVIWAKPFASGEAHMSHSLANLEYHHFKYRQFRQPGDVHVHFLGTGTLSFSDGIRTQEGDVFEITASPFTLPVRNPIGRAPTPELSVNAL
jgi:hypothetical protein